MANECVTTTANATSRQKKRQIKSKSFRSHLHCSVANITIANKCGEEEEEGVEIVETRGKKQHFEK